MKEVYKSSSCVHILFAHIIVLMKQNSGQRVYTLNSETFIANFIRNCDEYKY